MTRDIVLFLGAGFSREAELPVMSEFYRASRTELDRLEAHERGQNRAAAPMLCKAGNAYMCFHKHCAKAGSHLQLDAENIEDLFSMAEMLEHIGYREEHEALGDLYREVKLWLWKIYQQCPPMSQRDKCPGLDLYLGLMKKLQPAMNRLTVITTNYDVVWESLSHKGGSKSCYPFSRSEARDLIAEKGETGNASVSPGLTFVGVSDDGQGPLVCKLHGSVNYFIKGKAFGISRQICKKTQGIHKSGIAGQPEILGLDTIYEFNIVQNWVPEFVPPTYSKLTPSSWLSETWQAAIEALRTAKKVVFIGYSMPETDGFMKAMFGSAFAKRTAPPEIHVFDPSCEVLLKYKKFFRGIPVGHKKLFRDSVDDIAAICCSDQRAQG